MANTKVRVNAKYFYSPNFLDRVDGRTDLREGEEVRVVNLPGCPKAGTMGHAHVQRLNGERGGLVHVNSLHTKAEMIAYLRNRLAAHSDNPVNKNAIVINHDEAVARLENLREKSN